MSKKKLKRPKKRNRLRKPNNNGYSKTPRDIEFEYSSGHSILLSIGGFIMIFPTLFSLFYAFESAYFDLGMLLVSLFFLLVALASFYYVFKKRTYIFSKERQEIIVKKRSKTTIYSFDNVIGYYDRKVEYETFRGEELMLKTKKRTFSFSSNDYSNYQTLKQFAKTNVDRLSPTVYWSTFLKKIFIIPIIVMVILFLGTMSSPQISEIGSTDITLFGKPKYHYDSEHPHTSTWEFHAKEHPGFTFIISKNKAKLNFEQLSNNDKINIGVRQDMLEMKLLKTKKPTFKMKHFGWENVFVENAKVIQK